MRRDGVLSSWKQSPAQPLQVARGTIKHRQIEPEFLQPKYQGSVSKGPWVFATGSERDLLRAPSRNEPSRG